MVYLSHKDSRSGPPKASCKAGSRFQVFFALKLLAVDLNWQKLTEAQRNKPDFSSHEAILHRAALLDLLAS